MTKSNNANGPLAIPEDVKPEWLGLVRSVQAACRDNDGFAVLTIKVAVKRNVPVLWSPPEMTKLMPARFADIEITPEILGVISAFVTGSKS